MRLTDFHEQLLARDMEKRAAAVAELEKLGEQAAAGRITARGFMDELRKLAQITGTVGQPNITNRIPSPAPPSAQEPDSLSQQMKVDTIRSNEERAAESRRRAQAAAFSSAGVRIAPRDTLFSTAGKPQARFDTALDIGSTALGYAVDWTGRLPGRAWNYLTGADSKKQQSFREISQQFQPNPSTISPRNQVPGLDVPKPTPVTAAGAPAGVPKPKRTSGHRRSGFGGDDFVRQQREIAARYASGKSVAGSY
jgi:hypothetical protein